MFCINCGVQLPDDARFCMKCGKAQQPVPDAPTPTPARGGWEYREFSVELDGREYEATGYPFNGSIPWDNATVNRGFFIGRECGRVFGQLFAACNGEEGGKNPYLPFRKG